MVWHKLFGVGRLSGAAFTDLVARYGVECGAFWEPDVDREALRIISRGDVTFLENMYAQFLAIPRRQRLAYIRNVVLSPNPEVPATWTEARPLLRSVVRDGAPR